MTDDIVLNEETVEILCRAIAIQTVNDYRQAIAERDALQMAGLRKFFRSKWGNAVCFGAGEYIARMIEAEEAGSVTRQPGRRRLVNYKHVEILGAAGGPGRPYGDDAPRSKAISIKEAMK